MASQSLAMTMNPLPPTPNTVLPKQLARPGKVFRFRKPTCPHCARPMLAQVTGTVQEPDGTWAADSLDIECSDRKCAETLGPRDTQSTWQPVIDAIKKGINARYYFEGPQMKTMNADGRR